MFEKSKFHDQSLPQENITNNHNKEDWDAGQVKATELEAEDWMLDEEPVQTTAARRVKLGQVGGQGWNLGMGDLWWKIISPEDPANGVEPAKWDGDRARDGTKDEYLLEDYIFSFQEYEVLQENWVEKAIASYQ
ncbi:hypothetical protein Pcinc_019019 [Petrolisthes cinctipes]|uniref:Uncharacterized protein n=1 Tax=Petrolisthes cinctipes TaxID=88211 RepID=A0AAE1FMK4_PETCI|nr:hypothetical protein Pcinc_019019 [Petrolisthes cinctipes]